MSSSAKRSTTKQKVGKELSKKDITYIENKLKEVDNKEKQRLE